MSNNERLNPDQSGDRLLQRKLRDSESGVKPVVNIVTDPAVGPEYIVTQGTAGFFFILVSANFFKQAVADENLQGRIVRDTDYYLYLCPKPGNAFIMGLTTVSLQYNLGGNLVQQVDGVDFNTGSTFSVLGSEFDEITVLWDNGGGRG